MIKVGICDDDLEEHRRLIREIENGVNTIGVSEKLDIRLFTNGKELIEGEQKEGFDLVFLDIVTPLCDGFKVAAELNATHKKKIDDEMAQYRKIIQRKW